MKGYKAFLAGLPLAIAMLVNPATAFEKPSAYKNLYATVSLDGKHKILDEEENPKHDGNVYIWFGETPIDSVIDFALHPEKYDLIGLDEGAKSDVCHDMSP